MVADVSDAFDLSATNVYLGLAATAIPSRTTVLQKVVGQSNEST
jgi:hypothetical protein